MESEIIPVEPDLGNASVGRKRKKHKTLSALLVRKGFSLVATYTIEIDCYT